jgi:hypothetical protein
MQKELTGRSKNQSLRAELASQGLSIYFNETTNGSPSGLEFDFPTSILPGDRFPSISNANFNEVTFLSTLKLKPVEPS